VAKSLAYQVVGEGEINMVMASSFVSHVELIWATPEAKTWLDRLSSFCRLLLFDKAGVGLSDPVPRARSLEERASEIEAVMDAARFGPSVLMGVSEGGPASILFAATRPERVKALILAGTLPWAGDVGFDDLETPAERIYERLHPELGDAYTPSVAQIEQLRTFGLAAKSRWGSGEALRVLVPSILSMRRLGALERMSASPGMARATVEALIRIDVRFILQSITVPTLVLHATDDAVPVQGGRYLADHIPGARLVEFPGHDHAPWLSDPDLTLTAVEEFVTGAPKPPSLSHRALRTVLFSDVVSSTAHAAAKGDEQWRVLLGQLDEVSAELAERFGGRVIKSTGDGHLMTFNAGHSVRRGSPSSGRIAGV
jgi:pimeloyl-ACP methyl ester carboxylesterase